jgi:hypothetical protein
VDSIFDQRHSMMRYSGRDTTWGFLSLAELRSCLPKRGSFYNDFNSNPLWLSKPLTVHCAGHLAPKYTHERIGRVLL